MHRPERSLSNNASSPALVLPNGHAKAHTKGHTNGHTNGTTNTADTTPSGATMPNRLANGNTFKNIPSHTTRSERDKASHNRTENDVPMGPPADILHDPATEALSSHTYSLPIVIAVIPPMGALIYGKSDVWSDFLLLLLIAFYLYNIIKGELGT
jgi:hypothetical protein